MSQTILRRVTNVKTDGNGKLIQPSRRLKPKARYVLCEDVLVRPAKPIPSREKVVEWIEKCVLGDLRTVILGIEKRKEKDKRGKAESPALGGGNFLLASDCCEALEYFGQVYGKGTNATESVQKYVEEFLNPIDSRYIKVWPVLWDSFRNGIVHTSWTKPVRMEGSGEQISIGADNSPNDDHLKPDSNQAGKSFIISSPRFFCDIERSFKKGFQDWILHQSDDGVLERAAPQLLEIKKDNKKGKAAFEYIQRLNR